MQTISCPGHLLLITNIPYLIDKASFYHYLKQFGEISLYNEIINTKGMCFVGYFDSRSASQALFDINSIKYQYQAKYIWSNFFPIEKISSTVSVCKGNMDQIEIPDVSKPLNDFGEIRSINSSDDKKNIKVSYFDTRSSAKAINSGLNDFNIELISNSYYHEIEKVIPIYYERDNQNSSEIKQLKEENKKLEKKLNL